MNFAPLKAAIFRGPVILTTGDMPTRALIEAVIFEIEPAGIIKTQIRAENTIMNVSRYFSHDFNHMGLTREDPVSQTLVRLPAESKLKLLSSIDSLKTQSEREIAEHLVMIALREAPSGSHWARFFQGTVVEPQDYSQFANYYEHLTEKKISEADVKFAIDWWRAHLPIPKPAKHSVQSTPFSNEEYERTARELFYRANIFAAIRFHFPRRIDARKFSLGTET